MWIKGAAYKPLAEVWVAGLYSVFIAGTQADRKWWNCRINLQDELTRDYIYDYFESRLAANAELQDRPELRLQADCGGKTAKGEVRLWQLLSMMYCLAWLRYRHGSGQVKYDASLLRMVHRRRPWLLEPNKLPNAKMYKLRMQPHIDDLVPRMAAPSQILDMLKAIIRETHGVDDLPAELLLPFWPPYGASGFAGTDPNPDAVTSPFGIPPASPVPPASPAPATSAKQSAALPPDTPLLPVQDALAAASAAAKLPAAAQPPAASPPVAMASASCNDAVTLAMLSALFGQPVVVHSLGT